MLEDPKVSAVGAATGQAAGDDFCSFDLHLKSANKRNPRGMTSVTSRGWQRPKFGCLGCGVVCGSCLRGLRFIYILLVIRCFMRIGVPTEILPGESRVGLLPDAVRALVAEGHEVWVQSHAGELCGVADADFVASGALIVADVDALYGTAELVVKVKEPQPEEVALLRPDHIVFGFLHLAAHPHLLQGLVTAGCMALAYESIHEVDGDLPVLAPMSRIAGQLAVQMGAFYLLQPNGGKGLLLGAAKNGAAGHVVVLGCGVAGRAAIAAALKMGARVTALDIKPAILEELVEEFAGAVNVRLSTDATVATAVAEADLVVGAVLVPDAKAPTLVRRAHVRQMEAGSVIVDIAIDQGGCIETSRPTTHAAPTFTEEGVVHCCVANLPAAVARTATQELVAASMPYVLRIANLGRRGVLKDPVLSAAVNVMQGKVMNDVLHLLTK
jgi:alanine dehydrogenase